MFRCSVNMTHKLFLFLTLVLAYSEAGTYKPSRRRCPSEWYRYGSNCYYFCKTSVNFQTASSECKVKGGVLAIINSEGEDSFLREQAKSLHRGQSKSSYWISPVCQRQKYDYSCIWRHESSNIPITYKGWYKGEPNSQQSCAVLYCDYQWQWNDYACDSTAYYICEKAAAEQHFISSGSDSSSSDSDSNHKSKSKKGGMSKKGGKSKKGSKSKRRWSKSSSSSGGKSKGYRRIYY